MEDLFLGVMDLHEAKLHQQKLKTLGIELALVSNPHTCTTGSCKVTVEVWGKESDREQLVTHFQSDYMKHLKGHDFNPDYMSAVFDPTAAEVVCQACGAKFAPTSTECPDCGLVY